jgi:carbon storage regulator
MLVLDRRHREGFWIDGKVFVRVLAIGRNRVKLGVDAPPDVRIWRQELDASEREPAATGKRD